MFTHPLFETAYTELTHWLIIVVAFMAAMIIWAWIRAYLIEPMLRLYHWLRGPKPSLPALAGEVAGGAQLWTEKLLGSTFASWDQRGDIDLHSMTICREYGPPSGAFPARLYKSRFELQGAAGRNQVFCTLEISDFVPADTKDGSAGTIAFTYTHNSTTGKCDIPTLWVHLHDPEGGLETALRQAFAATRQHPVGLRLQIGDLSWPALKAGLDGDKSDVARTWFDVKHFMLWELWGAPINPALG